MKYISTNIVLDTGTTFFVKVRDVDIDEFNEWIKQAPHAIQRAPQPNRKPMGRPSKGATKIALARLEAHMTQQELANAAGVGLSQVQFWETGRYKPKTDSLIKLGKALNVDWTSLID